MKPFNVKQALDGTPVVNKLGYKVTDFKYSNIADQKGFCLIGLVHDPEGVEFQTFKITGEFCKHNYESVNDLFMAEPETWINVYYSKVQDKIWNSVKYTSELEAKENIINSNSTYLTTVKIS